MRVIPLLGRRAVLPLPPRTLRLRLTALYGALFAFSGAVLLAITYLLVRRSTNNLVLVRGGTRQHMTVAGAAKLFTGKDVPPQLRGVAQQLNAQAVHQHAAELHQLLVQSGFALAIMVVISIVLGWLVAGRALSPLRRMTATAREISARNLHERLAIEGPRDELKDLADTVDGLLGRLEAAFDAQRRFVANAAHELRTPLTLEHALLEETLSDRDATLRSTRATLGRLLANSEQQAGLLEALLTLASSERGLDRREPFDLAVLARKVLRGSRPESERLGLSIAPRTGAAPTSGDPALVERLAANLVDNAMRYNVAGGWVRITTGTRGDRAFLAVANSGPRIAPAQVDELFEPFQRLGVRTTRDDGHHGLGLSIVRAIAAAHGADLVVAARPEGGLDVELTFPGPRAGDGLRAAPVRTADRDVRTGSR